MEGGWANRLRTFFSNVSLKESWRQKKMKPLFHCRPIASSNAHAVAGGSGAISRPTLSPAGGAFLRGAWRVPSLPLLPPPPLTGAPPLRAIPRGTRLRSPPNPCPPGRPAPPASRWAPPLALAIDGQSSDATTPARAAERALVAYDGEAAATMSACSSCDGNRSGDARERHACERHARVSGMYMRVRGASLEGRGSRDGDHNRDVRDRTRALPAVVGVPSAAILHRALDAPAHAAARRAASAQRKGGCSPKHRIASCTAA